ncbi:DUF447 family protein [Candidatus Bathyarchaeota archaeon]|nr:DUF447 family protein [Candidatus Bathyarchaeota archaeon]
MTGPEFRRLLEEMGFHIGGISETILTTVNLDGSFNAAPMGVRRVSHEVLELRPFKSSSTFMNLLNNPKACINVTDNPGLFFVTAFKGKTVEGLLEPVIVKDMRLISASAHIFVDASRSSDISEIRACFTCYVTDIKAPAMTPSSFSRGRAEAIEAIIHATRIEVFSKEGRLEDVERLIKRFAECKDVVERVSAPDSVETRVVGELEKMITVWRGKA